MLTYMTDPKGKRSLYSAAQSILLLMPSTALTDCIDFPGARGMRRGSCHQLTAPTPDRAPPALPAATPPFPVPVPNSSLRAPSAAGSLPSAAPAPQQRRPRGSALAGARSARRCGRPLGAAPAPPVPGPAGSCRPSGGATARNLGAVWAGRGGQRSPSPTPCSEQGHLQLDQVARSPVQPRLECFQASPPPLWATRSSVLPPSR